MRLKNTISDYSAVIKSVPKFRKLHSVRYLYLFSAKGTFHSSTGKHEIIGKSVIPLWLVSDSIYIYIVELPCFLYFIIVMFNHINMTLTQLFVLTLIFKIHIERNSWYDHRFNVVLNIRWQFRKGALSCDWKEKCEV